MYYIVYYGILGVWMDLEYYFLNGSLLLVSYFDFLGCLLNMPFY